MLRVLQRTGRAPLGRPIEVWNTAAAAATTGGLLNLTSRPLSSVPDPSQPQFNKDLYEIIGVQPAASRAELKRAFRQRAKQLHPDAAPGCASHDAFAQLLAAYQVLSDPRSRQLYDLSRDRSGPNVLRAAAASGVQAAAGAAYEEVEVDLSWGLGSLFKQPPSSANSTVDRVRQELQGELHSAVRCAYLGPRLQNLDTGCFPDAFEADERAKQDCTDLLQLVHGRQVLGAVRERRLELLAQQQTVAAVLQDSGQTAEGPLTALQESREHRKQQQPESAPLCEQQHMAALGSQQPGEQRVETQRGQQPTQGCVPGARQRQHCQQAEARDADVLDLWLGEDVVASAVRHFPLHGDSNSSSSCGGSIHGPQLHHQQQHQQDEQQQQPQAPQQQQAQQPLPAEVIHVYGRDGQLLAQVEAQELDPGSLTASSARLLNPAGVHTHTVFRTQSPLVRHLTFAAEPAAFGMRTHRPGRLVVCRARRAWLPPSSLWLFKPLAYTHDIGGWCIEWAGHGQQEHPAWLHPAVLVLTAAFDSLDHERQGRQPLGLFGRVKAGQAEERDTKGGGWRSWASSVLQFHGYRKR